MRTWSLALLTQDDCKHHANLGGGDQRRRYSLTQGYRFKGTATIFAEGVQFEDTIAFYGKRGSTTAKLHIVPIMVERAAPLVSPVYDQGETGKRVRCSGTVTGKI